ncbi:uncharacterized protein AMSG_10325 [Thecamonas trahens ATCC 50062]|uniref:RNA methyltransferase n=1 Tax=Thecamonas trahens ATCC 50062 TaxID=461836 RepID=A0A0L0DQM1_THETB|nr:hypothetical protein AMSG_10325 [Thecamonas trahens ATCC 50062]KNC54336.1 hypothetical protein AMSG_10325 [Thecamonas trahens ATCC 50062]|eukprot:XP_013753793.1 hypothetical protein AMSG_10325 [Thecamonas trahens ATCC 50062]
MAAAGDEVRAAGCAGDDESGKVEAAGESSKKQATNAYGNYRGYYKTSYRDGAADARPELIPVSAVAGKSLLDIGCNSGLLTLKLLASHGPASVLGIDVDQRLIAHARQRLREMEPELAANARFACCDIMAVAAGKPVPSALLPQAYVMPERKLRSQDVKSSSAVQRGKTKFGVVLALSVSKWIHVHHGDAGLISFFELVYDLLDGPGSVFVLEPQPWSSYRKRCRFLPGLSDVIHTLQLRPDGFERLLLDTIGFTACSRLTNEGNFGKREMLMFIK